MSVITRFAPSPTGLLHIGGARTALFNWLYAKHFGGTFLLRIEDTDIERSNVEFEKEIYSSLSWLGLHWDGEILMQSSRQVRHKEIAYQLLNEEKAYRCYCTSHELDQMREQALSAGLPPLYDRRWRDCDKQPHSDSFSIRLKSPLTGATTLNDKIQGTITVANDTLDDMVLLRSDGTPTYMLAVVVDDHDQGITHIIRGDDHLTNAFRQFQIYKALNWKFPSIGHIPLIHGKDGKKLSKREGAISVSTYKDQGILPEALANALLRLGWSHGDDEKITLDQAIEWFDGSCLSKSAAQFDYDKVLALNSYYIRQKTPKEILLLFGDDIGDKDKAIAILPALQQRAKTLIDLKQNLIIYTFAHIPQSDFIKDLSQEDKAILDKFTIFIKNSSTWAMPDLEEEMRKWASENNLKFGQLANPLRLALTGSKISPSLTEVMIVLGQSWTLNRVLLAAES